MYGVVSFNLDHGTSLPVMAFCAANTNVSVEFSLGHCSKDPQAVEVGPPRGQRLVWPCGDESIKRSAARDDRACGQSLLGDGAICQGVISRGLSPATDFNGEDLVELLGVATGIGRPGEPPTLSPRA